MWNAVCVGFPYYRAKEAQCKQSKERRTDEAEGQLKSVKDKRAGKQRKSSDLYRTETVAASALQV